MSKSNLFGTIWRKSSYSGGDEGSCVEVATVWQKSSHSGGDEGDCIEVAAVWQKSDHSGPNEGDCVEVGRAKRLVAVRDSKDDSGPVLAFGYTTWNGLLTSIKTGTYDLTGR